jgi:hypothetical protein
MYAKGLKPKLGDIFVLLCIFLIAIAVLLCYHKSGDTVRILQNGTVLYEIHLDDPANDGKEFVVQGAYTNLLAVRDGKVFVKSIDCPDRHCQFSPAIGKDGGVICCVPNGMMVQVVNNAGLDVIVQ